jgi:signal transduction histidine kinase
MIFLCLSEILLNFWEHAIDDTNSILVAEGNENHIEIACADTGNGIITTLNRVFENSSINRPNTLKKSVEKYVTSKKMTNHMGYGLWILNQIAKRTNGRFHIYSEGAYFKNDFSKEIADKCGYWKGTIIYLSLPLKNPITLSDLENHNDNKFNDIKINWK